MVMHKKVGFFFENSENEQRSQLNAIKNNEAHPKEAKVIQYLMSGIDVGVTMIVEHDYLKVPPELLGEAILKSDGEWVWPTSLAYYVRSYHISLPEEFLAKMERENWRVSSDKVVTPEVPEGHIEM